MEGFIAQPDLRQLVTFAIGDLRCALPLPDVRAILPVPHLWAPPTRAAALEGFFNYRGTAVPVVALDRLFGVASGRPDQLYRHLLVPRIDGAPLVALLVDRVEEVHGLADDAFLPVTASETLNGCVAFEAETSGGLVHVLAADRILMAQEREAVAALYGMAQARMNEWSATPP